MLSTDAYFRSRNSPNCKGLEEEAPFSAGDLKRSTTLNKSPQSPPRLNQETGKFFVIDFLRASYVFRVKGDDFLTFVSVRRGGRCIHGLH